MSTADDDRAKRRGLAGGRNTAVIAGAGTGKTTRLIGEITDLIEHADAPLDRILAVTFTEAAASDMRQKLRERLETLWAERSNPRLAEALSTVERAQISTIHSFSLRILRENPFEAGIDPDFVVGEGLPDILLFDELWRQWAKKEFQGGGRYDETIVALLKRFSVVSLRRMAGLLAARPDRLARYAGLRYDPRGEPDRMMDRLLMMKSSLAALGPSVTEPDPLFTRYRAVMDILDAPDLTGIAERIRRANLANRGGSKKRFANPDDFERLKELIHGQNGAVALLQEAAMLPVLMEQDAMTADAVGLLSGFVDFANREKRKRGILSFFDIIHEARRLLLKNKAVRRRYQDEFDYVLVDEFQDTDPILGDIILLLAEDGQSADDPDMVRLRPGKLFIVGDPKQSIYRFRDAEVGVFFRVMEKIGESGGVTEELEVNYRSQAHLISFFNAVFAEYIRHEDSRYTIDYVTLSAAVADIVTTGKPPTVTVATFAPDQKTPVELIRHAEAHWIAERILTLVEGQHEQRIVRDRGSGADRGVEYRDIAILLRSLRGASSAYEEALKQNGIPYFIVGGRGYYQRQEISDVITILMAVFDPTDRRALAGVLRSPVFGIDDRTLYELSRADRLSYFATNVDPRVSRAFERLRHLHDQTRRLSLAGLVSAVFEQTDIVQINALGPGGAQRVGNLMKIAEETALLESKGALTLSAYLSWLRRLAEELDEEGEAVVIEEEKDAVKIMTIHQSKGLEFPVVFLPDLGRRPQHRDREGIFIAGTGEGVCGANLGPGAQDLGWHRYIREVERIRDHAEERRLFYVAATRTRDRLFLVGSLQEKTSHIGAVVDFISNSTDRSALPVEMEQIDPNSAGKYLISRKRAEIQDLLTDDKGDTTLLDEAEKKREGRLVEYERAMGRRLFSSVTAQKAEEPAVGRFFSPADPEGVGLLVGTLVHEVAFLADLTKDEPIDPVIGRAAAGIGMPADITDRVVAEARPLIECFLKSDMLAEIRSSRIIGKEVPILSRVNGTTVTGRIDIIFETASGIVVLDYKTDAVTALDAPRAAQRYRDQIGAYVTALTDAVDSAIPVKGGVYFLRAQTVVYF